MLGISPVDREDSLILGVLECTAVEAMLCARLLQGRTCALQASNALKNISVLGWQKQVAPEGLYGRRQAAWNCQEIGDLSYEDCLDALIAKADFLSSVGSRTGCTIQQYRWASTQRENESDETRKLQVLH